MAKVLDIQTAVVDSRRRLAPASGTIGEHRLIAAIGHGGMSDVFLAIRSGPLDTAKLLVVKRIRSELAEDPEFVAMFVDEARVAVRLNHPNVVHTTEVDEYEGGYYLAMEYLDGHPLSLVSAGGHWDESLPFALGVRIVAEVLGGLHHAHELRDYDGTPLQIVHRDVTPGNIFVTFDGQVKLVDFGIAKAADRAAQTQVGVLKGKAGYMCPEQILGRDVDRRADVFSAGVVLWELAAGRRLWSSSHPPDVRAMIAEGAPLLRTIRGDVPAELERICAKALAMDRAHRYETAAAMQEDLERLMLVARLRASSRDVGDFMMRAFPGERAAMRALVETRIGELRRGGELTVTKTLTHPSRGAKRLPEKPRLDSVPPEPTSVSMRPGVARGARGRGRGVAIVLAVAGGALALALLFVTQRLAPRDAPERAQGHAYPTVVEASPTPVPQQPESSAPIQMRIVAHPSEAQIFLDGAELTDNPFSGNFPRDARSHRIEVRAHGYETSAQLVAFESDIQLVVTLERQTPPVRRPTPTAPSDATARPASSAKVRAIDTSDPWR